MKVQWMNEVDIMTAPECERAGRPQWIATVSGTIGPFETQAQASDAVKALEERLPTTICQPKG